MAGQQLPTLTGAQELTNPTTKGSPTADQFGTDTVTTAYELLAYPALRPTQILDQFATVRATNESHRGSSVQFTFVDDFALATTPLTENLDVDSTALTTSTLSIGMDEYGAAVTTTELLRGTTFLPVDPIAAEKVGYNAGATCDRIAYNALAASTNVIGTGVENFSSAILRSSVLNLQVSNVRPMADGTYVAVVSPTAAQQLKSEADAAGWRYVVSENPGSGNSIYMGEIGTFEGVRIVVNNHLPDQGIGFVLGAEGLAKVYSKAPGFGPDPRVVIAPPMDKLRRFVSVGWKHLVGYGIFRPEAVVKLDLSATAV